MWRYPSADSALSGPGSATALPERSRSSTSVRSSRPVDGGAPRTEGSNLAPDRDLRTRRSRERPRHARCWVVTARLRSTYPFWGGPKPMFRHLAAAAAAAVLLFIPARAFAVEE